MLGTCYLRCAKDHLLSACAINRVHDGGERSSEHERAVHLMVALKSKKEELHRFSCFYKSQFSSFAAYDRKTSSKIFVPVRRVDLLKYTMPAASDGLFEEDRVFRFYIDTCQVNVSKDLLHTHARRACTRRVWLHCIPYLAHSLRYTDMYSFSQQWGFTTWSAVYTKDTTGSAAYNKDTTGS